MVDYVDTTDGAKVVVDTVDTDKSIQGVKLIIGEDGFDGGFVYSGNPLPVTGAFYQGTQPVSLASLPALAAGANVIGAVTQSGGPWSVSVSATVTTKETRTATTAITTVDDRDSPRAVILASNSNRLGATIFNDSTADLYLLLGSGANASTTNFSVKVAAGGYYEVPFNYTGAIDGVWGAAGSGNARVTEFTA